MEPVLRAALSGLVRDKLDILKRLCYNDIKRSGTRELFDRDKLKRAVHQSVGKFLKGEAETEEIVTMVENDLYALGENEITSKQIGDLVLEELLKRNEVAYIRFASVYHEFKTIDEFAEILKKLKE
jgi:transcriptional repressor NrdR